MTHNSLGRITSSPALELYVLYAWTSHICSRKQSQRGLTSCLHTCSCSHISQFNASCVGKYLSLLCLLRRSLLSTKPNVLDWKSERVAPVHMTINAPVVMKYVATRPSIMICFTKLDSIMMTSIVKVLVKSCTKGTQSSHSLHYDLKVLLVNPRVWQV